MKEEKKIFEFYYEISKEKDFILAPNVSKAKEFVANLHGEDDFSMTKIEEIPIKEMKSIYVVNPEEPEPEDTDDYDESLYSGGYKIICSFKEIIDNTDTECDIIATTAF